MLQPERPAEARHAVLHLLKSIVQGQVNTNRLGGTLRLNWGFCRAGEVPGGSFLQLPVFLILVVPGKLGEV